MAKDLLLKHVCPHFVVGEWLAVEDDRKRLIPIKNPSSSQVVIERNGVLVPQEGLFSKVSIAGTEIQPFEIKRGVNDTFRFTVNEGSLQTATLPSGERISAAKIAQSITEQTTGIQCFESNGRVRVATYEGGDNVTLFLKKGSAHLTLGFPDQRFYQGREVVPPWNLVKTPNTVDELARHISFERPLKTVDDVFEVSYYTRREDCRRCQGIGVEHDLRHDTYGDPEFVDGIDLLVQEVEKIVFTIQGSNIFYSWYGTSLSDLIGSKIARAGRILESQLVNEISTTLERYRNVKIQQSKHQPVGDQEFLLKVKNIFIRQDQLDPTIFRIRIDLQNRAQEVDQIRKTLSINSASDVVR